MSVPDPLPTPSLSSPTSSQQPSNVELETLLKNTIKIQNNANKSVANLNSLKSPVNKKKASDDLSKLKSATTDLINGLKSLPQTQNIIDLQTTLQQISDKQQEQSQAQTKIQITNNKKELTKLSEKMYSLLEKTATENEQKSRPLTPTPDGQQVLLHQLDTLLKKYMDAQEKAMDSVNGARTSIENSKAVQDLATTRSTATDLINGLKLIPQTPSISSLQKIIQQMLDLQKTPEQTKSNKDNLKKLGGDFLTILKNIKAENEGKSTTCPPCYINCLYDLPQPTWEYDNTNCTKKRFVKSSNCESYYKLETTTNPDCVLPPSPIAPVVPSLVAPVVQSPIAPSITEAQLTPTRESLCYSASGCSKVHTSNNSYIILTIILFILLYLIYVYSR